MTEGSRDNTVLISGASTGIGRATALAFAGGGARVLGLARDAVKLDRLAEQIGAEHFVALPADVTDAAGMQALARSIAERFGPPDVIVANAGLGLDALFADTDDERLRKVMEVNLFGVVRTVRPFVAGMAARGSGRIILVSSIVGKRGIPYYSAYSASKFALHGLADALSAELHGTGVSVGIVCPSSTRTEFQDRALREGAGQRRVRPRSHSAESVARAVVRMSRSRRREMILGVEAKLLCLVDTLAPRLVDRLLSRMLIRDRS